MFPFQISSAFTGGAKELICWPHSSSQMLAGLLGVCNPDCLGGKDGDLEPVLMCCKECEGRLCHLSASQQCAKKFSFLLPWVIAILQFANANTTQVAQLQLSSLLPSSLSEEW